MWRRVYLVLWLVRLYFALSPSYIHPDENFQGPEVIAGQVFRYPIHLTWEFTSDHPIRSTFPLWVVYGVPMMTLRALWEGPHAPHGHTMAPYIVYYTLRIVMVFLSVVLEDWALQELVPAQRNKRIALVLTASSYVTWTYQTHTFSNSIETLVVLWTLVLIQRIIDMFNETEQRTQSFTCMVLAFLITLGTFNRITFPAYILFPLLKLLPHFWRKPLAFIAFVASAAAFSALAIIFDTAFYKPSITSYLEILRNPIITPLNSLLYNVVPENLANHGLHPFYQHFAVNLPLLLGPAFPLVVALHRRTTRFYAAISGVVVLSLVPHQEARFLLAAVPLLLSSVHLPRKHIRIWFYAWAIFNAILGLLMGTYHQGGVVPMQIHIAHSTTDISQVFWWKTYSPPIWLLDGRIKDIKTVDLMGMQAEKMVKDVTAAIDCTKKGSSQGVAVVAPASATFLDKYLNGDEDLVLEERWRYTQHLNLDDLDIGQEGVFGTLSRVVGRRGLVLFDARRKCK